MNAVGKTGTFAKLSKHARNGFPNVVLWYSSFAAPILCLGNFVGPEWTATATMERGQTGSSLLCTIGEGESVGDVVTPDMMMAWLEKVV
jgi:hypothetical protein